MTEQNIEFACAINCIDGRTMDPVSNYLKKHFRNIQYIDTVTKPGVNKVLAEGIRTYSIEDIQHEVGLSVNAHNTQVVAISAHPYCLGNPSDKKVQIEHLRLAYNTVKSFGFAVKIILLWVNDDWKTVEVIPMI